MRAGAVGRPPHPGKRRRAARRERRRRSASTVVGCIAHHALVATWMPLRFTPHAGPQGCSQTYRREQGDLFPWRVCMMHEDSSLDSQAIRAQASPIRYRTLWGAPRHAARAVPGRRGSVAQCQTLSGDAAPLVCAPRSVTRATPDAGRARARQTQGGARDSPPRTGRAVQMRPCVKGGGREPIHQCAAGA